MHRRWLLQLTICAALALCCVACRKANPQTYEDGLRGHSAESVEDSGRRLSGDFIVQAMADEYGADSMQTATRWTFSFKEDGGFRSERQGGGGTRIEEGSYLISAQGELVLYIETAGGEALTGAHQERYRIEAESDGQLKLRRNGSMTMVLHRK